MAAAAGRRSGVFIGVGWKELNKKTQPSSDSQVNGTKIGPALSHTVSSGWEVGAGCSAEAQELRAANCTRKGLCTLLDRVDVIGR